MFNIQRRRYLYSWLYEEILKIITNDYNDFHDRNNNYFDEGDNNSDGRHSLYSVFFSTEQDGDLTNTNMNFEFVFNRFDKRISKYESTVLERLKVGDS
jgi:hypothetical protein